MLRHGRPSMSDSRGHVAPNPTSGPEPPVWPSTVRRELQPLLEARVGPDGWISDNLQFQRPKAIYLMILNGKDHDFFVILNQQFQGSIILMVFDLQGMVSSLGTTNRRSIIP